MLLDPDNKDSPEQRSKLFKKPWKWKIVPIELPYWIGRAEAMVKIVKRNVGGKA